ncbi:hypothetical protein Tco_0947051 [Tanacetum coccineum]
MSRASTRLNLPPPPTAAAAANTTADINTTTAVISTATHTPIYPTITPKPPSLPSQPRHPNHRHPRDTTVQPPQKGREGCVGGDNNTKGVFCFQDNHDPQGAGASESNHQQRVRLV